MGPEGRALAAMAIAGIIYVRSKQREAAAPSANQWTAPPERPPEPELTLSARIETSDVAGRSAVAMGRRRGSDPMARF
eukprot:1456557-Prymnesium_polylepis.1